VGAMFVRSPHLSRVLSIAVLAIVSACAAEQRAVIDKLDEVTAVTITYSRTPITMSTDTYSDVARDFVQIGAIEVNRMGTLNYYLWLGISQVIYAESTYTQPEEFESVVFAVSGEEFQLKILGWTQESIGAGERIYKKLFRNSADAYYEVTLEQIQLLIDVDAVRFRTTGPAAKEYEPWYRSFSAKDDLEEFLWAVSQ